jgi:hypothetical protein
LTLLCIVVGIGSWTGAPVAYAHHEASGHAHHEARGHGDHMHESHTHQSADAGHFAVDGTSKHSVLKSKDVKDYRVCSHHGSGPMKVTHDGQTTILDARNCSDFAASDIDVEGKDGTSASGHYHPIHGNHN